MFDFLETRVLKVDFLGKQDIELILSNESLWDISTAYQTAFTSVIVGLSPEMMRLDVAMRILNNKSRVVLENSSNDWPTIKKWVELFNAKIRTKYKTVNSIVYKAILNKWLVQEHAGGGGGTIAQRLKSLADENYADICRNFFELVDADCLGDNMDELASRVDVIFTATPQGFLAGVLNEDILNKVKIIDLSADFRIKDVATYEKWYKIEHKSPQFIKEAVYGLCEINRDKVTTQTRLIANPGCYTTCSILTAYPLVKEGLIDPDTLIIDAKSGTSGAGRGAKTPNLFCEVNESMKAYGVTTHRHTPEIEEQLGYAAGKEITVNFTPHLVPMNRGILATEYATLIKKPDGTYPSYEELKAAYDKYYAKERFVRVLKKGVCPETKWVEGSNYVDVNFVIDERTGRVVMMGALENLVKGAAGQAVQNMNLLFGFDEAEGLSMVPMFP